MAKRPTNTSTPLILLLLCSTHIAHAITYELQLGSFSVPYPYVFAICWSDKDHTAAPEGYGEPTESFSSLEEYQSGFTDAAGTCKVVTLGPGTWHGFSQQEEDAPSMDMLYCRGGFSGGGFVAACPDDHVLWLLADKRIDVRVANGVAVEAFTIGAASGCAYNSDSWLGCNPSVAGVNIAVGPTEIVGSCTDLTIDEPFVCRDDSEQQPASTADGTSGAKTQVRSYFTNLAGLYLLLVLWWLYRA